MVIHLAVEKLGLTAAELLSWKTMDIRVKEKLRSSQRNQIMLKVSADIHVVERKIPI